MAITITSASICSRATAPRRLKPACEAFRGSRSGVSTGGERIRMASRSLPRPSFPNLVLTPGIQRVVEGSLEGDLQMVVLTVDHGESVRDRFQAHRLRCLVEVSADVGSMHDLGQAVERRVVQPVLEDDRLKAATAVHVPELDATDVVGDRALAVGHARHLLSRRIEELGVGVDEAFDQPGARDPVDAGVLSGYPLHNKSVPLPKNLGSGTLNSLSLKYRHLG